MPSRCGSALSPEDTARKKTERSPHPWGAGVVPGPSWPEQAVHNVEMARDPLWPAVPGSLFRTGSEQPSA